jgi:FkbM family methyltransferase
MPFTSHSQPQTRQDIAVAEYFAYKRGGYFVDVGAYDGVHFSNTLALERDLGWAGICIEPLPHAFAGLKGERRAICLQIAAYSQRGEVEFVDSDQISGLGRHLDRWEPETRGRPRYMVKTDTLANILDEHHAPAFIEYLSIDTEGSELEVLYGIDFARWRFGYITIEHNFVEPRRGLMRKYLEARGYKHHRENEFDDDYVRVG